MKTIESSYVGRVDEKSRRRVNSSSKVANITASAIEGGVDIESLEKINVPVFRYGTQITIHGKLPDLNSRTVLGYKSLIKNQNGSIGVRYVAIDGKKKQRIMSAYNLSKTAKMTAIKNSTGLTLQQCFGALTKETLLEARALINDIPDCFVGSKRICRDAWGRVFVVVDFGSIYWKDLFTFIDWLTSGEIRSDNDLSALKEKREKEGGRKSES